MNKTKIFTNPILQKLTQLDFDKFYTKRNRILYHFLVWIIFAIFLFLQFYYMFNERIALFFTIRYTFSTLFSFYLFSIFFNRISKIFQFVILFIISTFLWLMVSHSFFILAYYLQYDIHEIQNPGKLTTYPPKFIEVFSVDYYIKNILWVLFFLVPFFFLKTLMELAKTYSSALKFQKEKSELEVKNINIEKDFLKTQLNPHFLFNTLNNLYGLTVKKSDLAPEVVLNLSEIMSYNLYESNTEKVSLEKELDFIRNYVELEKMRYSTEKDIQLKIEGEENALGLLIAPLLTFTLIENAFKYGLKSKHPFINIQIKIEKTAFSFIIENDAIFKENSNAYGGIGLENVKKRLQLIYPEKYEMNIGTENNIFTTTLKIDL